jgi:hypothetical protein
MGAEMTMPPLIVTMTSLPSDSVPQVENLRRRLLLNENLLLPNDKSPDVHEHERRRKLVRAKRLFKDDKSVLTVAVMSIAGVPSLILIDSCAGSNTISSKNYKRIKKFNEIAGVNLPPIINNNIDVHPMGMAEPVPARGDIVLPLSWDTIDMKNNINAQFLIIDHIPYDAILGAKFISDWCWKLNPSTMTITHNFGRHVNNIDYALMPHRWICHNSNPNKFERPSLPKNTLPERKGNSLIPNLIVDNYEIKNNVNTSVLSGGTAPGAVDSKSFSLYDDNFTHSHHHMAADDLPEVRNLLIAQADTCQSNDTLFSDDEINEFSKVWNSQSKLEQKNCGGLVPTPTTPVQKNTKPIYKRALWRRLEKEIISRANEKLQRAVKRENSDNFLDAISHTVRNRYNEKKINIDDLSWDDIIRSYRRSAHISVTHCDSKTIIDDDSGSIPIEEAIMNEPADLSWSAFERVGNDILKTNTYVNGNLNPTQKSMLTDILNNSSSLTAGALGYLPLATKSMVHFDTGDSKPISIPPYRLKTPMINKIRDTINNLLTAGIIYRVKRSDWNSPIVLVDKPDGSIRLCVDFSRTLNTVVKPDNYPIPTVMDTLDDFEGAKFFTKIDCKSGYFGLLVAPKTKKKRPSPYQVWAHSSSRGVQWVHYP